MSWVFFIFAIPLFLLVVLLSVPLTFKARGRTMDLQLDLKLAWGRGLLTAVVETTGKKTSLWLKLAGITLPTSRKKSDQARASRKKARQKKRKEEQKSKQDRQGFSLSTLTAVFSRELLTEARHFIAKLFKSLRLRLQISGVYGTDDPALTGLLAALMAALGTEQVNINLNPDFSEQVLDVKGEASGRVVPIIIIGLAVRLLLSKPMRKLWWTLLKKKLAAKKIKKPREDAKYV